MFKFDLLQPGMTRDDVVDTFGPPEGIFGKIRTVVNGNKVSKPALYFYGNVEIAFGEETIWYVMDKGPDNTNHRFIYQNGMPIAGWLLGKFPPEIAKKEEIINAIRAVCCTNEAQLLLKPIWRKINEESGIPTTGFCYIASEALFYLLGGKDHPFKSYPASHYKPCRATIEINGKKLSHWWLQNEENEILDPTADQFPKGFDYSLGKRNGFLTKNYSYRTKRFLEILFSLCSPNPNGLEAWNKLGLNCLDDEPQKDCDDRHDP